MAEKHRNYRVLERLKSISSSHDSIVNETKYHLRYWVDKQRIVQQKDGSISTQEIQNTHQIVADIEIINFIRQELEDPTQKVLTTNLVEKVYKKILADNGLKQEHQQESYKKHLKQLIIENINDVKFIKSPLVNETDRICNKSTGEHALDVTL